MASAQGFYLCRSRYERSQQLDLPSTEWSNTILSMAQPFQLNPEGCDADQQGQVSDIVSQLTPSHEAMKHLGEV